MRGPYSEWTNMLLSNDEGVEIRHNILADNMQFRCEPWGNLEYIASDRADNAIQGYGLYQRSWAGDEGDYTNYVRNTIFLDSEITMQRPQFFPGDVQWHYVGSMPQVDGGVYLAKIGNVVYLNLGDQLLRGIIGDGQVVFKGGQATSINLPTPVSGVDLPNRISDTIHMLKSLESWTSEKEYEATEEDVIFDYDPAARRLSSRKGFLFETPLQMPTFYSNKIPYPEATSHFDRLVLNDVPDLYSGVECMADAVHYGNAYISEGKVICDRPTDITIYSAAGAKVTDTFGSEYDFTVLPSGIYIIKAGDRTFKIRR